MENKDTQLNIVQELIDIRQLIPYPSRNLMNGEQYTRYIKAINKIDDLIKTIEQQTKVETL